jgi:hypothetical protein
MLTGKRIAFVTSRVTLCVGAIPDLALLAMHEPFIRQATTALYIFHRKMLTIGKGSFSGNCPFVQIRQPLLKLVIIVTVRDKDGTDAAIKTTR